MPIPQLETEALLDAARTAREAAYAPYSGFRVGAAVLGGTGKVYTGCNVENASYGLTVCAERIAIWKAISEGEKSFLAVAIIADGPEIPRPCGACLQVMQEFAVPGGQLHIIACAVDGPCDTFTLANYLPMPFRLDARGSDKNGEK